MLIIIFWFFVYGFRENEELWLKVEKRELSFFKGIMDYKKGGILVRFDYKIYGEN